MRTLVVLILVSATIAGCESPERTRLAHYDLANPISDPLYGMRLGDDTGVHRLGQGWTSPQGKGMWTVEDESTLYLQVRGRDARLTLACSTSPPQARRGQVMTVWVNGHEANRYLLTDKWAVTHCDVELREEWLVDGLNEIRITSSHKLGDLEGATDPRRLGIFVRSFTLTAVLSDEELAAWNEYCGADPPNPDWRRSEAPADVTAAAAPAAESRSGPDVLVLLLDAARADHFSSYGYERETTPEVDALAEDGIRMEDVHAEASYTLCSVPTLLTGTSWRDHGVVKLGHALSQEFVTWAEVLSAAGYQTLGVTCNANVSRATGADQGFDTFVETYRQDGWEPETAEDHFAAELGRADDRPLFAYVHLMPPHSPYYPAEHDLWPIANYQGPVTGSYRDIHALDKGDLPLHGPDRDRLVSLYDGRLRRGDAQVGRIVRAWKQARGNDGIVVITSDHGEAFGEHGRFSHNSTVYDEMIHVPLVLHPRRKFEGLVAAAPKLYSLADVMPLVLHFAGVPLPAGSSWTGRFLTVYRNPRAARNVVFTRAATRLYGVRSSDTLSILRLRDIQERYLLREDPKAQTDVRSTDVLGYRDDIARLRAFLEGSDETVGVDEATLSEEDLENLEALGYI